MERKLIYYRPDLVHSTWVSELVVSDQEYDKREDEYKTLCKQVGIDATATDMVGFNMSRPSCRLIVSKYSLPKGTIYVTSGKRYLVKN